MNQHACEHEDLGEGWCGDLFTFRGGKIALKNSYRKNRPPLASTNR